MCGSTDGTLQFLSQSRDRDWTKKKPLLHLNKPGNEVKTCDKRKDKQQTEIIVLKGVEFTCYYFSSLDRHEKLQVKGWEL